MKQKREISKDDLRSWLEPDASDELLNQTEADLIRFAALHAVDPNPALRQTILDKISRLKRQALESGTIDLSNPPLITPESNYLHWQAATSAILPPAAWDEIYMHPIRSDETVDLFVIYVSHLVPEEVHHDVLESFLLLEGSCQCNITDEAGNTRTEYYSAGDYIAFAHGEVHDVRITSAERPAKAILQWLKKAA